MTDSAVESQGNHGQPLNSSAGRPRSWLGTLWKGFPVIWPGMLALGAATTLVGTEADPGIKNTVIFVSIGLAALGISLWLVFSSGWSPRKRLLSALIPLGIVYSYSPLGPIKLTLDGDLGFVGWQWRWGQRADEKLTLPSVSGAIDLWRATPRDYPRFLGNGYWAEVSGVELETNWEAHPPRELWRKKIGAGWSAFSIVGNYAITQEQRDQNEMVTCYHVQTGEIVWTHSDPVRWDPTGGGALGYAGPRATPTIHAGKVYVQGATGLFNCLEARTGERLWSHDIFKEHGGRNVTWGKSCSPLIVDETVVVSVGAKNNQSLVAYAIDSGEVVWASGEYQSSYASPVVAELAGVRQIVSVDEGYVTSRRADNGQPLWEYEWPSDSGASAAASQPIPLPGDQLFLSKGYGHGSTLLQITRDAEGDVWQLEPLWPGGLKPVMKTKLGNVVIHDGFVYGIDDVNLQCIDLATGSKRWKQRRRPKFGHGQILLVGDFLLVLSEGGEVILVKATPEKYRELASMRVFDDSQITWNNPAFSPPYLLLRNAEEAACYELPLLESAPPLESTTLLE